MICSECNSDLPSEAFGTRIDKRNGGRVYRYPQCRTCFSKLEKARVAARQRKWNAENWERSRAIARRAYLKYMSQPTNRVKERARTTELRRKLRQEFMDAYGSECACCGLRDTRFLTLDHVRGDGAKKRKEGDRWHYSVFARLRKQGWPAQDDYQILCFNCNCAKGRGGLCPHQEDLQRIKVA